MVRPRLASVEDVYHRALDFYLRCGYDRVTTAEVASACGVSPATFFRYAGSREQPVLAPVEAFGKAMVAALVLDGRHPWTALADAARDALASLEPGSLPGKAFAVLAANPGIRGAALNLTRGLRRDLAERLVELGAYAGDQEKCEVAAAAAIGLLQRMWGQELGVEEAVRSFAVLAGLVTEASALTTSRAAATGD